MAFSYRETQIVKGMLARGDKQHDIASYFGVNGGRVAEVATGNCDYPTAPAADEEKLPPPGPYVGAKTLYEVCEELTEARALLIEAGDGADESLIAFEVINGLLEKLGA